MDLKSIKVQLIKQDQEPQFNIQQFEDQKIIQKNHLEKQQKTNFKKQSKGSIRNVQKNQDQQWSSKSHMSSILNQSSKGSPSLYSLKKRNSQYQSISPQKSLFKSRFVYNRPVFSATKNKKPVSNNLITRGEIIFQRTSYSPTIAPSPSINVSLSPQRKSVYWQTWLLPSMNSTVKQSITQALPKITAKSYCVMLSDTNEIISSQNMTLQKQIASLTKIMTAYTALNICSTFGIKIREHYVAINKQSAFMNGTSAGLKPDEDILIIDLLYALLLPSGNDAGIAIAQYFGKFLSYKFAQDMNSNERQKTSMNKFYQFKQYYDAQYDKQSVKLFVFQMNKNCHKIGLKNTHFNNATGLSDKRNYSTAQDMALLTSHCLKNHTLRTIFKKKFHICQVRNNRMCHVRQIEWKNTNRHLFQFRECIGVKTGITPTAGPCLSSAYKIMGREVIVIVLECESVEARYKDAQNLFKWARKKIRVF